MTMTGGVPIVRDGWGGPDTAVSKVVLEQSARCLESYDANPTLIEEHANIERSTTQGGYGHRQLYELVQNGADELQTEPSGGIHVVLIRETLYCANAGTPITPDGVETILASHLSRKRGTEIGRFGLGFKSVLSVSDRPQFFSRSGSFGWDARQARTRIRERVPGDGPTPVLRMAQILGAEAERANDPTLAELMEWAATVVKLPLLEGHAQRLAEDIDSFPDRFAIFSPHVGRLVLEDRRHPGAPLRREIRVEGGGDRRSLTTLEAGETRTTEWMVFETTHSPSEAAKESAGEYHGRDRIPLAWAVPTSGNPGPGEFWAFFPTTYATTLRGVLNAPWKTNEDRQNLLKDSPFNDELMEVAAELIVESLPRLSPPDDPARHLSLITARGREARNWADKMLTDLLYKEAAQKPSLPDQDGTLRRPFEIKLHPDKLKATWLTRWADYPGRPADWCHRSIEDTTRRSRAEVIMEQAGRGPANVKLWLEALVTDGSVESSAVALSIVAEMVQEGHEYADMARQACVLRTESGLMTAPMADTVFRRTELDIGATEIPFVDPSLEELPGVGQSLSVLGIREADATGRFAALTRKGFEGYKAQDWDRFWAFSRAADVQQVVQILRRQRVDVKHLRVRTSAGDYRFLELCLLPGKVVPGDSIEDAAAVVDTEFHRDDLGVLSALGMTDAARVDRDPSQQSWYTEYCRQMVDLYYRQLPADVGRPQKQSIMIYGPPIAGPLEFLTRLSRPARARFLDSIPAAGLQAHWQVRARTRRSDPPLTVQSPLVWMLKRHGVLATSQGLKDVDVCVGGGLVEHRDVLPVVQADAALAAVLSLPDTLDKISGSQWLRLLGEVMNWEEDERLGDFYALAATQVGAPDEIRCRTSTGFEVRDPAEVAVAAERTQFGRLVAHGVPTVLAQGAEAASRLVESWGMVAFADALVTALRMVPTGPRTALEDLYPQLRLRPDRPLRGLDLQRCVELEELVQTGDGQLASPLTIGQEGETVYYSGGDDDLLLLREINNLIGLGLSDERIREVLRHREEHRQTRRIVQLRRKGDDIDRFAAMLLGPVIKGRLPQGLVEHVERAEGRKADTRTLAELAFVVHGRSGVLRAYRAELEEEGFTLPAQLAGGHSARKFVADLGFPAVFAGQSTPSLEPRLMVDGPVDLPPLHDYQEQMVARMVEVLQSRPPQRGMLSLPTGAGKTRVAVEATIRALRALPETEESIPLLWIAQSAELCEQAVQSWQFVWRAIGPAKRLAISRLWESNEADPAPSGYHLVIATDAKLDSVIESAEYEWLRVTQAVVVDEAHTSITTRYTKILSALGVTRHRTRCPLIGLSATPYRGNNKQETDRLVARYGHNRLDHDSSGIPVLGENPYPVLQDLGILAKVRHVKLQGADLELDPAEHEKLTRLRHLPSSAARRLSQDTTRNTMLLDQIEGLAPEGPVLLFATSVDHAFTMAALLTRRGVSAAPISSGTDPAVRRQAIESFKRGEVRVLTNYGVLHQGFDAPATRTVIVARPTYSPNVYQQMIGRGLRGPKNGGKDECFIVNVADNVLQYGEELAFHQFEHLWKQ
ncbi:DEAD/DEAH box helicase family protein [Actinomadura chokoriensis]|uniref:DEAD/DEAH box helicase family protein n=1 Tax=Actinomadura chokoriensis TaxID=454156 RepID=A0ABV4QTJ9_9ACTN